MKCGLTNNGRHTTLKYSGCRNMFVVFTSHTQLLCTWHYVVNMQSAITIITFVRWTYHSEEELDGEKVAGSLHTYSGAGYYQNLAANSSSSSEIIAELKKNLWIDRGTRVVFFDFSVYNANINLFCIIRCVPLSVISWARQRESLYFVSSHSALPFLDID